jgi:NAD(P)-dependent dehydrogenase (short-subunit alcohol dehydrogenase family)
MDLTNTSTIVTGGAGGLGEGVVRAVVEAGGSVVIADLADEKGEKLAAELGDGARYLRTDVLDDSLVASAIAAANDLAPLRFAVTAHGGWGVAEKVVQRDGSPASLAGFTKTLDLYLTGTYNMLRLAAAAIAKNVPMTEDGQRGAVVTTASIAAFEGQTGQSAYAAAKAGVVGLTLVAARDLAAVGVRVVCIAPGTMLTPMMETVGPEMLEKFRAAVPFPKRLGRPDEFGALAVHALSNTYLNGEVIRLDGAQRFQAR